jgi:phosphatidylserine/phosphatidylglycerophosphate/cardiolipin synthase-like enzyme
MLYKLISFSAGGVPVNLLSSLVFSLLFVFSIPAFAGSIPSTGTTDVYFSPKGGGTTAIVNEIQAARKEILVQAYSFTSTPIAKALLDAHKRGVKVDAILDKSQKTAKYSSATFLFNAGVPVLIDNRHAIAHNKIMIIDRSVLITGSFNFTKAAEEKNAENLLIMKGNPKLIERYLSNFEEHKGHSEVYAR